MNNRHDRDRRAADRGRIGSLKALADLFGGIDGEPSFRALNVQTLEQRVLLNAAPVDASAVQAPESPNAGLSAVAGDEIASLVLAATVAAEDASLAQAIVNDETVARREVVFVDQGVANWHELVDDLWNSNGDGRELDVVLLSKSKDGIAQISQSLANYSDVDAVHIISHGTAGTLQLGSTTLTNETIGGYAGELAAWGRALSADADLLLYGCDLASSSDGRELVEKLATVTDSDVAASSDVTGHLDLDGDWDLEYVVGDVETDIALSVDVQASWMHVLDFTPDGGEVLVNTSTAGTQLTSTGGGSSVAVDSNGNCVVVFTDISVNSGDIYLQRYDSDGNALGGNVLVNSGYTTGAQQEATVAMDDAGNFVVVWESNGQDGNGWGVYAQRYDSAGVAQGSAFKVNTITTGDQRNASISMSSTTGDFIIVWRDGEIYGQRYNSAGVAQGSNFLVNTTTTGIQYDPDVAMRDDGSFIVAWSTPGTPTDSYDLVFQQFNSSGTKVGSVTLVQAAFGTYDSVEKANIDADGSGNFAIAYYYNDNSSGNDSVRLYDSSGTQIGSTISAGSWSSDSHVAMDGSGGLVLTYQNITDSGNVYWRQFDATATAVTTAAVISTTTTGGQSTPSVAVSGEHAVMVWRGVGTGDSGGVFVRQFSDPPPVPQTFTVTNTNDSGAGSLRQAITNANVSAGTDTIQFAIGAALDGDGLHRITLASALPQIHGAVIIDATTDNDFSGTPIIVLDGNDAVGNGLNIAWDGDGTTIRGFIIQNFTGNGIQIDSTGDGNTIVGNWIGSFDASGANAGAAYQNAGHGIFVGSANNTIGGTTAADRNVISGNYRGVVVSGSMATNNRVFGNYIGTDDSGVLSFGNVDSGITVEGDATGNFIGSDLNSTNDLLEGNVIVASGNNGIQLWGSGVSGNTIAGNNIGVMADGQTVRGNSTQGIQIGGGANNNAIGGTTAAAANIIGGNTYSGIELLNAGTSNNTIYGNFIGTDATGTLDLGNGALGIFIQDSATNNIVGGIALGQGNTIAFNDDDGVGIQHSGSTGNTVRGNSIYSNGDQGVDLGNASLNSGTANDTGDSDVGGNTLLNWAVVKSAGIADDGTLDVVLDTTTLAAGTYTVDVYASSEGSLSGQQFWGQAQGERYLGTLTSVSSGNASLARSLSGITATAGEYLTIIVTDASGNTSEFSNAAVLVDSDAGGASPTSLTVTRTSGGGLSINQDGGNDTYLQTGNGYDVFGGLTKLTLEARLTLDATPSFPHIIDYATDAQDKEFSLLLSGDTVRLTINDTSYGFAGTYTELRDGSAHTVSVAWDGSVAEASLYIDGAFQEAITGVASGYTISTGGVVVVGNDQDVVGGQFQTSQSVHGTLYDIRVFDDVRSDAEVAANYATTLPFDEAGLITNWRFDSVSTEGVVADVVGGANLTLKHTEEPGFVDSEAELILSVDENALNGTIVGTVAGADAERDARIASLLAGDSNLAYNAETGKFYKVYGGTQLWSAARTAAESTGLNGVNGQLATIRSAYENELVRNLVATTIGYDAWIGGTDSTVEGEWRWVDGGSEADLFWSGDEAGKSAPGAYQNFAAGQPNDAGNNEDVLHIDEATGLWSDADHDTHNFYGYVVEWDADKVLDATQALTYSITSQTASGAFAIDSDTGEITVADGSLLDYEAGATQTVTVRVTDVDGNTFDRAFSIALTNLVEAASAPTDLSSGIELNTDGGNDSYLYSTDVGSVIGGLQELTLEVTFSSNMTPNAETPLLSYATSSIPDNILIFVNASGDLSIQTSSDILTVPASEFPDLFDGKVHSVAFTWLSNNGRMAAYVDGNFVGSMTGYATGAWLAGGPGDGTIVFGNEQDSLNAGYETANVFSGTFYDVRLWNEYRSSEEIALNYQHKFDSGSLPSGLVANWQMDRITGPNEVVDVVSFRNLVVGHAGGVGFTASEPTGQFSVDENEADGSHVGYVVPSESDAIEDIVSDGQFQNGPDPGDYISYSAGQTFGDWTVVSGQVGHVGTHWAKSPLGGNTVDLNGPATGAIQQTLATEPGRQYQVVFAVTGNWESTTASKSLRVSADGVSQDLTLTYDPNFSLTNMLWQQASLTFTASGLSTDLQFQSLSPFGDGAVIGDVRVVEVPQAVSTILNNDPTLQYDAATDKFYRFVNADVSWTAARDAAVASKLNGFTGQLVTISSAYENELIRELTDVVGKRPWIGASDQTVEGEWRWQNQSTDGDQFWQGNGTTGNNIAGQYQNWNLPNPQASSATDDYAIMLSTGEWADRESSDTQAYVIEWDASEVLSNFTFSLTDDAGGRFAIDGNTGEITVADGSLIDYETATSHNVTLQVTDAAGSSYSEAITIAVDNRGGEPAQFLPAAQNVDEDTPLVFSTANGNAITVTDQGPDDARLQVFISTNNNGTLTLSQTTGLSILGGSNGGTFMTIHGSESDINAALDGMTFNPVANYSGPVTLDVITSLSGDMVGEYQFAGNANDTSVGIVQHGTFVGDATTVIDPERGEVLSLDGDGDHVEINSLFGNSQTVTLAAWVNAAGTDTSSADIISIGDSVILRLTNDGRIGGLWRASGGWYQIYFDVDLVGQGWQHIAYTVDATNDVHTLYLNGEAVASQAATLGVDYDLGTTTRIGVHGNGQTDGDFNGLIDDARIYTRALSADEISALAADSTIDSGSVAIAVNPVNDPPVFSTTNSTPTFSPGGAAVGLFSGTSVDPVEVGDLIDQVVVTITNLEDGADERLVIDGTSVALTNGNFAITSGNSYGVVVVKIGSTAQVGISLSGASAAAAQALVDGLAYENLNTIPQGASRAVTLSTITDNGGGTDTTAIGVSSVVSIGAAAPTITVPIGQSVNEDSSLAFSSGGGNAVTVAGVPNSKTVTATLSVSNGTLTLAGTTGITFLNGTADGTSTLTIAGTQADINAALDGLTYLSPLDFNGSDTLSITTGSTAATEDNLYARWEFEGGSLQDETANGYDGSAVDNPTGTSDIERGDVMTFDGNDRIDVAGGTAGLGDEVTIAAWVNLSAGQQDNVFLSIGDEFYVMLDQSNVSYSMGVHVNGFTTNNLSDVNNIAGEGWNHIAATINDITKETKLYLNGELIRGSTFAFTDIDWGTAASPNITIGALSDGSRAFVGSLDDVRVYNAELTEPEIVAVMGDHGYGSQSVSMSVDAVNDAPVVDESTTYLSSLTPTSVGSFLAGLKNDVDYTDGPITLNGVPYERGIFGHANGTSGFVEYAINGATSFRSMIGIEGGNISTGVTFRFYVDGALQYTSPFMSGSNPPAIDVNIDTAGGTTLRLEVDFNGNNGGDHSVWADARFLEHEYRPSYTEGGSAVPLFADAIVQDIELDALNSGNGNYAGASLTLLRNGGANVEDVFSFNNGNGITRSGSSLDKNGQVIATFDTTSTVGEVLVTFTDANGEIPTAADVTSILQQVTYTNTSDTPLANVQIDWTLNDGNAGSQGAGGAMQAIGSVTVDITAVNDAPVNAAPASLGVFQETSTSVNGLSVADPDDRGGLITTRLQVDNGVLNVTLSGAATVSAGVNGSGDLTIQGTEADVNASLANLSYTGDLGVTGVAADTLTMTTDDGGNTGIGGALQDVSTVQIDITPLGGGVSQLLPSVQNVDEDNSLTFSTAGGNAIVVNDGTAATDTPLQVLLNVQGGNGTLTLSQTTGLIFASGANGSANMVIWGTEAEINAALEGAVFTPNANYNGPADIAVSTRLGSDVVSLYEFENAGNVGLDTSVGTAHNGVAQGNVSVVTDGTRGSVATFDGTGDAIDLTAHLSDYTSLAEGTISAWVKLSTSADRTILDFGDGFSGNNFFSFFVNNGQVLVTHKVGGVMQFKTTSTATVNDGNWHHIAFTISSSGNELYIDGIAAARTFQNGSAASTGFLSATPSLTTATIGAFRQGSLQGEFLGQLDDVRIDSRAMTAGEVAAVYNDIGASTGTISLTVNSVNDSPTISGGSLPNIPEDAANPPGDTISNLVGGSFADNDTGSSLSGIVVTSNNAAPSEGDWQYSTDGGSNWFDIGSTGVNGLVLSESSFVRFAPAAHFNGTATVISFRALDDTYSGGFTAGASRVLTDTSSPGGSSPISSSLASISQTVTGVNDAPAIAINAGLTVGEGATGAVIDNTMLLEGDPDDDGAELTYIVDNAPTNGTLYRSGVALTNGSTFTQADIDSGIITYDHDGSDTVADSFDFTLFDGGEDGAPPVSDTFLIAVAPSNDLPTITSISDQSINEDTPTGALAFSVSDAETANPTVTATSSNQALVPDANLTLSDLGGGNWTIVVTPAASQFGGPATITLTVDDGTTTASTTFDVTVSSVNDAPAFTSGPGGGTYNEGGAGTYFNNGILLGDADNTDFDAGVLTVTITAAGEATDELVIRDGASVTVVGTDVRYNFGAGAVSIGTLAGGAAGTPLTVTFNTSSTVASVEAVSQQVAFRSSSDVPSELQRTLTMSLTDGDGGSTGTVTRVMNVIAGNDAPTFANMTGSATTFVEGGAAVILDADAEVFDAELAAIDDFGGASLTIVRNGGAVSFDRYSAGGTVTQFAEGNDIVVSGVTVGSLDTNSGGDLLINFYNTATSALVNELIQQIAYEHTGPNPPPTVTLDWTFSDANTGSQGTGGARFATAPTTVTIVGVNNAPSVTAVADQTIVEDGTTGPLAFTVADAETAAGSLSVSATSSDQFVFPDANLALVDLGGGNWTIEATSAADANGGPVTITVVVSDGAASSFTTFDVTVTPVNDAPLVSAIADQTIAEDGTTGPLAFTVSDVDVDTLTVTATSSDNSIILDADLTLVDLGGGNWTIEAIPAVNANGEPVTITVTIDDGTTTTQTTFDVTVTAVNDAPTVTAIGNQSIIEDSTTGPLAFTVGDVESAAGLLTVAATSSDQALIPDSNLTLVDLGAGNWTIEAVSAADQNGGPVTISITVGDGAATTVMTFDVTIVPTNDAPTVTTIADQSILEDGTTGPLVFTAADLDGDSLLVSASSSNQALVPDANLTLIDLGGGNWTIEAAPLADVNGGPATITITVDDGTTTTITTFDVTVTAVNDAPTVTAIADQTINEDGTTGPLAFSVSDVESAVGSLTVVATSSDQTLIPDANLTLVDLGGGNWTIEATPLADANGGPATITLAVGDGTTTTTTTFNVTVTAVNDTPTVTAIANQTIAEDGTTGPLAFTVSDVETAAGLLLVSATSSDQALMPDANLTLIDLGGGNWTVQATPIANANGGAVVTLTVTDGTATTATSFRLTVNAVNDVPTVTPIGDQSIVEDSSTGPLAFSVTDVESAAGLLTVTAASSDQSLIPHGNLTLVDLGGGNWTIEATPVGDAFGGPVTISLTVSDGSASTTTAFDVTVSAVNDPPTITAIADQLINEDGSTGALLFAVGDVETASPSLVVTAVSSDPVLIPNSNITLTDLGGGNWTVEAVPVAELSGGPVTITVTVSDGGLAASTTFDVVVVSVNDTPHDLTLVGNSVSENAANGTVVGLATVSDRDPGDAHSYSLSDDANGRFVIDSTTGEVIVADGTRLNFEAASVHVITIRVTDAAGASYSESFTINVQDLNDAPEGRNATFSTTLVGEIRVDVPGLLATASDEDGDPLSAILVSGTSNGTLVFNADGSFSYTPFNTFTGTDAFVYRVTDGVATSSPIVVSIEVNAVSPTSSGNSGNGSTGGLGSVTPDSNNNPTRSDNGDDDSSEKESDNTDDSDTPDSGPVDPRTPVDSNADKLVETVVVPALGVPAPGSGQDAASDMFVVVQAQQPDSESSIRFGRAGHFEDEGAARDRRFHDVFRFGLGESYVEKNPISEYALSLESAAPISQADNPMTDSLVGGKLVIGATKVVSTSLTVGYVVWMVRGGTLVASLVASLPAWTSFDPLAVVSAFDGGVIDDGESLHDLVSGDDIDGPANA